MARLKVGINGLGRIGRLIFRYGFGDLDIVAVNGRSSPEMMAHLIQYDSVHGRWDKKIEAQGNNLVVEGVSIPYLQASYPEETPWEKYAVDIVVECTGKFKDQKTLKPLLDKNIKHVIISAPSKDPDLTLVYGVNHDLFDQKKHFIVSNASCTTNCLAPIVKVLHKNWEVKRGFMTTIHSYTNDQKILDSSHQKDFRRARTAALNMIPTSTGAGTALSQIFPDLKNKIQGMAVRVPVANVSLVDLTVETKKETSLQEVNQCFKQASQKDLKGVLGFEDVPLVSSDFIGRRESSILDALSTEVVDKNLVKVLAWYDNEAGFSQRVIDFISHIENK